MSTDYDLGTGSVNLNTKRFIWRYEVLRDRNTKEETTTIFCEETIKKVKDNGDLGKIVTVNNYMVELPDAVVNTFRGHNNFLSDLLDTTNATIQEYNNSGSVASGSIREI